LDGYNIDCAGLLVSNNTIVGEGIIGRRFLSATAGFYATLKLLVNAPVIATSTELKITVANTPDAFTNNSILRADGGSLTISGGTLSNFGSIEAFSNAVVTLNAPVIGGAILTNGNIIFNAPSQIDTVSGTGTLTITHSGTTTISGAYSATGPVNISNGTLAFGPTNAPRQTSGVVVKMQSLTMGSTQVLDISNHDLIIGNTSYATVQNQILAAFGIGSGPVITSSTSNVLGTGTDNTILIPIDATAFGLPDWDGVAITEPNSVIVKYALFGDISLDGIVNGDDYAVLPGNFNLPTPGISDMVSAWLMGDVTLDGVVNGDDYAVLAGNFGLGPMGEFGMASGGSTGVPEPANLMLLGVGAVALRRRRAKQGPAAAP
jgi:hypothetical protein